MPRIIEWILSVIAIVVMSPVLFVTLLICAIETRSTGVFLQERVGRNALIFKIIKLKTMVDNKVTRSGLFFRKYKLDELPQLINIFKGEMSFVGPRPDVQGYYDHLTGEYRKILELRPGITSLAAIKYRNEEYILAQQEDPLEYNDTILFPDKVKLNLDYYNQRSFVYDIKILIQTLTVMVKR